jgi:hypothetical protein
MDNSIESDNSFQAINSIYLSTYNTSKSNNDEISVHRSVLTKWMDKYNYPVGQSLLVRLTNPLTDSSRICCLGEPHMESSRKNLYIPSWLLENIGLSEEYSEDCYVTIEPFLDVIPSATKIYLKPLDNAIYHDDIRDCFEKALDTFHVLEKGCMLTIMIEALGGYKVSAYVDNLEPNTIVKIGGEVEVEFLEPDAGIPEFDTASNPILEPPVPEEVVTESEPMPIAAPPDYKKIQDEVRASWLKRFNKDNK